MVPSSKAVALKKVSLQVSRDSVLRGLLNNEIRVLSSLPHHPNIVKREANFVDQSVQHIVYEFCDQGDLLSKVSGPQGSAIPEVQAQHYLGQILEGLAFLKKHQILHRDIKLENMFLKGSPLGALPSLKLGDFGFCCGGRAEGFVDQKLLGSRAYQAPEILTRKFYSFKGDLYAAGICYYQMLIGRYPYSDAEVRDLIGAKKKMVFNLDPQLSPFSKQLITAMIHHNLPQRKTVEEVQAMLG